MSSHQQTSPQTSGQASSGGQPGKHRWAATSALAAVAAVVVASGLGCWGAWQASTVQSKDNDIQTASQNASLEGAMIDLDSFFAEHPTMHPFFYADLSERETQPVPAGELRDQAFSTAERIIDLADEIAGYMRTNNMVADDAERWQTLMSAYFHDSPTLRLVWKLYHEAYDDPTACLLGAPRNLSDFNWRDDTPPAHWPDDCSTVR
jgi:hypothetical protein